MAFPRAEVLREKGRAVIAHATGSRTAPISARLINFSAILNESVEPNVSEGYDIFLSHSYKDKFLVAGLREAIKEAGFSIYVDWIDDPQLDRTNVTREAVELIRTRMTYCKSMIYAFSDNAVSSMWMPWELGFMDGVKERVAIMQVNEEVEGDTINYQGREYLSLYNIADFFGRGLWVNGYDRNGTITYSQWLTGMNPARDRNKLYIET